jgi:hypothetical protein
MKKVLSVSKIEMVEQGKEIQAALKLLELALSKGIQIDLTGVMNTPFVLPT